MADDKMELGFIPFKPMGDLNTFEKEFMPMLEGLDLTQEYQRRNLITSIWHHANNEWRSGYKSADNDEDFDD